LTQSQYATNFLNTLLFHLLEPKGLVILFFVYISYALSNCVLVKCSPTPASLAIFQTPVKVFTVPPIKLPAKAVQEAPADSFLNILFQFTTRLPPIYLD